MKNQRIQVAILSNRSIWHRMRYLFECSLNFRRRDFVQLATSGQGFVLPMHLKRALHSQRNWTCRPTSGAGVGPHVSLPSSSTIFSPEKLVKIGKLDSPRIAAALLGLVTAN